MKSEKGITMIALILTIILLLILAIVGISSLVGENGIMTKAHSAKDRASKVEDSEKIAKISGVADGNYDELKENDLPEITTDTEIGTIVRTPNNWNIETAEYISTKSGEKVLNTTRYATVYAVAIGNNEIIPVPYGFYYVGGDLNTGVIISDNEVDKYDGITDKTTWEYTTNLVGNQFVWIPCTKEQYVKTSFGNHNASWNTDISKSEIVQIEKYGGFYIGRYEAGLASTIEEHTKVLTGNSAIWSVNGIPQSKAGLIPWVLINYTQAKKNAESMFDTAYVSSGLVTGIQWDVTLNRIIEKTDVTLDTVKNSSSWGNYKNNSINYKGRKVKVYQSNSIWQLPVFGKVTEGNTTVYTGSEADMFTTGASSQTEKYHIFDMAGNVWEWTEELSLYATSGEYRFLRGACFWDQSTNGAGYRYGTWVIGNSNIHVGFRTVLYIK